jgi:hypothetical protein
MSDFEDYDVDGQLCDSVTDSKRDLFKDGDSTQPFATPIFDEEKVEVRINHFEEEHSHNFDTPDFHHEDVVPPGRHDPFLGPNFDTPDFSCESVERRLDPFFNEEDDSKQTAQETEVVVLDSLQRAQRARDNQYLMIQELMRKNMVETKNTANVDIDELHFTSDEVTQNDSI